MLYLRWLETSRRRAGEPAVFEGDRVLSFGDLARAASMAPRATGPVIARSGDPRFFVEILRAWRDGQAVIPIEADAPEPVLKRAPGADIRLVKHTPGATGVPRGIFFTAGQVMADADQLAATMDLRPEVPNLAVISLAHSYGFGNLALPLLLHGVALHWVKAPFPRVVEEAFRRHDALVVPAVPSMWRAWQRAGILAGAPIRLAVSASAPLAPALEREAFAGCGLKIHNFYGASECGGIAFDATGTPRADAGLLGAPVCGVRVEVAGDGRLIVHSRAVADGYDESRPDDRIGAGVYRTRDLGRVDGSGSIHLTGTTGAAINVAGRKISPAKIEAAVAATGLVSSVRVFGQPSGDAERCEEIAAEVALRPGVSLAAVKSAVAASVQSWETPRLWRIVP